MSAIFGKDWKINRVVKGTPDVYYELGGTVIDARLDPRLTVHEEVGSGEGRQLTSQKVVAAKPIIEWTQNIKRLDDYILGYAILSEEAAVPAHTLYVTDGTERHDLSGCKVNSCRITIRQNESIKAALSVLVKTHTSATTGTFKHRTDPSMYKNAVTTLTLHGAALPKWEEIEINVENNVLQDVLGTDILPAEVEEQEAKYSMRITRARVGISKFSTALNGTKQDFVIALQDNRNPQITKTFTFNNMLLTTARKEDRQLGIIMERLEGKGKSLVVT